jgi:hypothetical protein
LKDLIKCNALIIFQMSQINFIWDLIGKTLSLGAQFGLNWEDWNFKRLNIVFTKLINWNEGQNRKKIEVLGSNWNFSQPKIIL